MPITGKVALVSGAERGIGRAIAQMLVREGIAIGLNALNQESADAATAEIVQMGGRAVAVAGDVSDQDAVDALVNTVVRALGPIDILVNNAAAPAEIMPFERTTQREQDAELVTLIGTLNCTRSVLTSMIERRWGRIVNISSVAGRHGQPGRAVYSAANAGIDALSQALAFEVGRYGITVNAIAPGAPDTPRFRARSPEVREAHRRMIALPDLGEPEDVASCVLALIDDRLSYVNGAVIDVDGGFAGYEPWHLYEE